jgi:hypothetical protein
VTVRDAKARHGRREVRLLWLLADPALNTYIGSAGTAGTAWPGVQQVARVERLRLQLRRGREVKREREISYAITSLAPAQAAAPRVLAALRGHWGIENRAHWVRDVTFDEDRSQVRTGAAPEALAAFRNVATTLLRRAGRDNIAAALRTLASRPPSIVRLVLSGGLSW